MTATELQEIRRATGLSQPEFAEFIGINYHSLRAYERNGRPIPELLGKFIQYKMKELAEQAEQEEKQLNDELRKLSPQRKRV